MTAVHTPRESKKKAIYIEENPLRERFNTNCGGSSFHKRTERRRKVEEQRDKKTKEQEDPEREKTPVINLPNTKIIKQIKKTFSTHLIYELIK